MSRTEKDIPYWVRVNRYGKEVKKDAVELRGLRFAYSSFELFYSATGAKFDNAMKFLKRNGVRYEVEYVVGYKLPVRRDSERIDNVPYFWRDAVTYLFSGFVVVSEEEYAHNENLHISSKSLNRYIKVTIYLFNAYVSREYSSGEELTKKVLDYEHDKPFNGTCPDGKACNCCALSYERKNPKRSVRRQDNHRLEKLAYACEDFEDLLDEL